MITTTNKPFLIRFSSILLSLLLVISFVSPGLANTVYAAPTGALPADSLLSDLSVSFKLGDGTDIEDGDIIKDGSKVQYHLEGTVSNTASFQADTWYSIDLNPTSTIQLDNVSEANMLAGSITCGRYSVENGVYYFKIDQEYLSTQGNSNINIWLEQFGTVNFDEDGASTQEIGVNDVTYEVIPDFGASAYVGKTSQKTSNPNEYQYTVTVTALNGSIVIDDIVDEWGQYLVADSAALSSITATDSQSNSYEFNGAVESNKVTFTPKETLTLAKNQTLTLKYNLTIDDDYFSAINPTDADITNTATVNARDNSKDITASNNTKPTITKTTVNKTGTLNKETGVVTWTIRVTPGQGISDISDIYLVDTLGDYLTYDGTLNLANVPLSDFTANPDDTYTLSYETSVAENVLESFMPYSITNTAVIKTPTTELAKNTGTVNTTGTGTGVGVTKSAVPNSYNSTNNTLAWTIQANIPEGMKTFTLVEDQYYSDAKFTGYGNGSLSVETDITLKAGTETLIYGVDYNAAYNTASLGINISLTEAGLLKAENSTLEINYLTNYDTSKNPETQSISNKASISYGDGFITKTVSPEANYYYPNLIIKGDLTNGGKSVSDLYTNGTTSTYSVASDELVWTLLIDQSLLLDEDGRFLRDNSSINIADILPEGLTYVDGSATAGMYFANTWSSLLKNSYYGSSALSNALGSALNVSADGRTLGITYTKSNDPFLGIILNSIEISTQINYQYYFPSDFKGIVIVYKTKVDNASTWLLENSSNQLQQSFVNNVTYTAGTMEGSAFYQQQYDVQEKTDMVDKSYNWSNSTNKAEFTITVNPQKASIATTGNSITIIDELTAKEDNKAVLTLDQSAGITVSKYGDSGAKEALAADEWSYSYDNAKGIITFNVPDNVKLEIKYTIAAIGAVGNKAHFTNEAYVKGYKVINGTTADSKEVNQTLSASSSSGVQAEAPMLAITKYASGADVKPLEGVTFKMTLYNTTTETDDTTDSYTSSGTNSEGLVIIGGSSYTIKADNIYHLEELSAPAGYQMIDTYIVFYGQNHDLVTIPDSIKDNVYEFDLGENPNIGVSLTLYDEPVKLTVEKTYKSFTNETATFTFGIFDDNESTTPLETKTLTISGSATGITDSLTFEKLDASKAYYIYELDADGNKVLNNKNYNITSADETNLNITVSGNANYAAPLTPTNDNSNDVKITNEDDTSSDISISKTDIAGNELIGAELTVYAVDLVDGLETETEIDSWISNGTPHKIISPVVDQIYKLVENQAPLGYNYAEDIYFKIDSNGTVFVSDIFPNDIESTEGEFVENANKTITMIDAPVTLTISKVDVAGGSAELPNAEMILTNTSNQTLAGVSISGGTAIDDDTLSENQIAWLTTDQKTLLSALPDGTYELQETIAPDGYSVVSIFNFEIKDGVLIAASNSEVTVEDGALTVADARIDIVISKQAVGGGAELAGATITLTNNDNKSLENVDVKNANIGSVFQLDNSIKWIGSDTPALFEGLPAGNYTLTETAAPAGYAIKTETMTFTIDEYGNVTTVNGLTKQDNTTIVMEDAIITVDISKTAINLTGELDGATLVLTNTDGKNLSNVTGKYQDNSSAGIDVTENSISWVSSADKGDVKLSGLLPGSYELTEITAPNGYTIAETIIFEISEDGKITINGEEVNKVTMTDAVSTVAIQKLGDNGEALEPLAGAGMKLTYTGEGNLEAVTANGNITKDGNTISWISEETPLILEQIPNGDYVLEEIAAPDGYEIATEISFSIVNGEVTNIKVGDTVTDYEGLITMIDALQEVTTTTSETTTVTTEPTTVTTVTTEPTTVPTVSTEPTTVTTVSTEPTTVTTVTTEPTTVTTVTTEPTTVTTVSTEPTTVTTVTTEPTTVTTVSTEPTTVTTVTTEPTTVTTVTTEPTTVTTVTTEPTTTTTVTTEPTTATTVTTEPTTATVISTEPTTATIISTEPTTATTVSTEPTTATTVTTEPTTATVISTEPTTVTTEGEITTVTSDSSMTNATDSETTTTTTPTDTTTSSETTTTTTPETTTKATTTNKNNNTTTSASKTNSSPKTGVDGVSGTVAIMLAMSTIAIGSLVFKKKNK